MIDVSDDPNCAKCDIRAVCIRLSNTSGVSCVCLPGFALSPLTGGCVLQGNIFWCYVKRNFFLILSLPFLHPDTCQKSVKAFSSNICWTIILNYYINFNCSFLFPFFILEIPLNGLCDSRYECFNGGKLEQFLFFFL